MSDGELDLLRFSQGENSMIDVIRVTRTSSPISRHLYLVTCLLCALLGPLQAHAQAYPVKPIRVIVPAAPGDSCDVLPRLVGQKVGAALGQPLSVDNRVGAGGQLGLQLIAQAPPDGYTLGCGQGGNMVIVPIAYKKVAYDT